MALSINFTDEEFEYIRAICRLSNTASRKTELVEKLDALNSAEVLACKRDIERWKRIEYGTERSKGGIKGTDYSTERDRYQITNNMRERLDYPLIPFPDETALGYGLLAVPSWIGSQDGDDYSR